MALKNCNALMCIMIKIGNMLAKNKKKKICKKVTGHVFFLVIDHEPHPAVLEAI